MPYYEMNCQKAECQHSETMLMKYDEMKAGVECPECSTEMRNHVCAAMVKDFGSGPQKRIMAPDVGPNTKGTRAWEKKMDDANSHETHKPGGTFGTGGLRGYRERQAKLKQMDEGKIDFTK